jgi:hypothetical protein
MGIFGKDDTVATKVATPAGGIASSGQTARGPSCGLAWSAFLGCSWTWCIGMFLPVLLVRDFGIAGFLTFAVPNVVGAAAMGRVLPDAQSSRLFVGRHRAACAAFSAVTIVFHFFFIAWMVQRQIMPAIAIPLIAVLVAVMLLTVASGRGAVATAWIVLVASVGVFVIAVTHAPDVTAGIHFTGALPSINLLGLAPVCIFGFLLCPYLDLTFHRARQSTSPRQGVVAFFTGFGGCFVAMILFTLWYSRLANEPPSVMNIFVMHLIGLHMAVQSAFTIAAHLRSVGNEWSPVTRDGLIAGLLPAGLLMFAGERETTYRVFLAFYGLLFPAYLWIGPTTRRGVWVTLVACALAAPMYWMGFIDNRMVWLLPAVAILLIARWPARVTSAGHFPVARSAAPTSCPDAESKLTPRTQTPQ